MNGEPLWCYPDKLFPISHLLVSEWTSGTSPLSEHVGDSTIPPLYTGVHTMCPSWKPLSKHRSFKVYCEVCFKNDFTQMESAKANVICKNTVRLVDIDSVVLLSSKPLVL